MIMCERESVCDVIVWVLAPSLALCSNFCRIKSTSQIFIIHLWSTNTLHDILSLSRSHFFNNPDRMYLSHIMHTLLFQ